MSLFLTIVAMLIPLTHYMFPGFFPYLGQQFLKLNARTFWRISWLQAFFITLLVVIVMIL